MAYGDVRAEIIELFAEAQRANRVRRGTFDPAQQVSSRSGHTRGETPEPELVHLPLSFRELPNGRVEWRDLARLDMPHQCRCGLRFGTERALRNHQIARRHGRKTA